MKKRRPAAPVERAAESIPELCQSIGISESTFYKLQALGEGPVVSKIGRRSVITAENKAAWLRSRERRLAG